MTDGYSRLERSISHLDTRVESANKETTSRDTELHDRPNLRLVQPGETRGENEISVEELYPRSEASSRELRRALELLTEGSQYINLAVDSIDEGDILGADDAVGHLQVMMPELFCCRSLGDSYGAVISAVMASLRNRESEPLSNTQVRTLSLVLTELRRRPFMKFDQALELIDWLEGVDLNTEPEAFPELVGWIDD